jgi:hypothetical protein
MIKCPVHGNMGIALVSPDLVEARELSGEWSDFLQVQYAISGDVLISIYVSEAFAREWNIQERGETELPRDYPAWVKVLIPQCYRCAIEASSAGNPESRPE